MTARRCFDMRTPSQRRGLTLIELMLALTITVMISGAVAAMLAAVASGVDARQDQRSVILRAGAAQARLSSYIVPSRAVLNASPHTLVLWANDNRPGGTIHASELRWIEFHENQGVVTVSYFELPDGWSDKQRYIGDMEYAQTANFASVRNILDGAGVLRTVELIDGLEDVSFRVDSPVLSAQLVGFVLVFETRQDPVRVRLTTSIRQHTVPEK